MYLSLSPFFYYLANKEAINDFIIIESNGAHICTIPYKNLKLIVSDYVNKNSNGVDEHHINDYIVYICDKITS